MKGKGSIRRTAGPGTALLLILLLLAPFAPSLSAFAARTTSDCGMACCKRTKVCCCRKVARERQPAFRAPSQCDSGCGLLPAVHGPAIAIGVTRLTTHPSVTAAQLRPMPPPVHRSVQPLFTLFERPPPPAL